MKLQLIDDSNRAAHWHLTAEDRCYFFYEYTSRKGFDFSPGNQFISNFKKSPLKSHEAQYRHKLRAIKDAISAYRKIFDGIENIHELCTFSPMPPSKIKGHAEYDDRMWQVVQGVCKQTPADARELIVQTQSYEASHLGGRGGSRIKPDELQALYRIDVRPPKATVFLFDDVLSAGSHFRAAKMAILARYPETEVIGMFLARRVLPDAADDFDTI